MKVRLLKTILYGSLGAGLFPLVGLAATANTSISVSATVLSSCVVSANPHTLINYDPVSGSVLDGTSNIAVTCTLGTPFEIGLDAGTGAGATVTVRKMTKAGGGALLNYSLYQENTRSTVWGNTTGVGGNTVTNTGTGTVQNFTVYSRILASQAVPSATYNDTITVTVTY